jgi:hypothetical protein
MSAWRLTLAGSIELRRDDMTYRPPKQLRYKTVAELQVAYRSGELKAEEALMLDNDSTDAYRDDEADELESELVFSMHPDQLLEQALDLLGIPHEHV